MTCTSNFRILSVARVHCPHPRTFFRHQRKFLHKAVAAVWEQQQAAHVKALQESRTPLVVAGDGRCDSMGHRLVNFGFIPIYSTVLTRSKLNALKTWLSCLVRLQTSYFTFIISVRSMDATAY